MPMGEMKKKSNKIIEKVSIPLGLQSSQPLVLSLSRYPFLIRSLEPILCTFLFLSFPLLFLLLPSFHSSRSFI